MRFSDSVAAINELNRLMQELQTKYDEIHVALRRVPLDLRNAAVEEVAGFGRGWYEAHAITEDGSDDPPPAPGPEEEQQSAQLPSATQAILGLLAKHEDGLTAEQIRTELRGRFHTASGKPERVLISTLSQLRGNSRVLHDNGRYSLVPEAVLEGEAQSKTLKQRVIDYFLGNGNEPTTTLTLAKATGAHPNAIRSLFSEAAPTFVVVEEENHQPNTPKLWMLNAKLLGVQQGG